MDAVQNDLSDVAKLNQHFTDRRAQELALEAETQRAQHVVQMGGVRNERIRKTGIAALLGGAGIGLACFGASFLIAPNTRVVTVTKEIPGPERVVTVTKEVPGPERVVTVTKEVPGPERVVTKEVPGPERVVTKEVPGPERVIVKEVPTPEPTFPPTAPPPRVATPSIIDTPKTPEEKKFVDKPEYKDAAYHGRIIKSVDGRAITFADGKSFWPARWDDATGKPVDAPDEANDSDPFVGDLGMCVPRPDTMWVCTAMHDGREVPIPHKEKTAAGTPTPNDIARGIGAAPSADYCGTSENGLPIIVPRSCPPHAGKSGPTPPATTMVNVHVFLGTGYPATAMVDTGCSWPMSLPQALADVLVKRGLAIRAGKTTSMLADGSQHDVDVIMIKAINVEGRVLQDVEASVSPGDSAPILLGLGALNRLGPFKIEEGGSSLPAINQHDPRIARLAGASGRAGLAGHGGLHHRP